NLPSDENGVGLIGGSFGTVENVILTSANITGAEFVGALVGYSGFGAIKNSSSSGTVTLNQFNGFSGQVGGLVGGNYGGSISGSSSSANVSGVQAGGLVGYNSSGSITNSYSSGGTVTSSYAAGGLAGFNGGSISTSWSSDTVNGGTSGGEMGGLVGYNTGSITNAYATGNVTGNYAVGGLIGANNGTASAVYAIGAITGFSNSTPSLVGALVGWNTGGKITNGYWNTDVVGTSLPGIDNDTSGNTQVVQGLTTAQLQAALPTGFSTTVWGIVPNVTYPFLLSQPGVVSGTVFSTFGGPPVNAGVSVSDLVNGV